MNLWQSTRSIILQVLYKDKKYTIFSVYSHLWLWEHSQPQCDSIRLIHENTVFSILIPKQYPQCESVIPIHKNSGLSFQNYL